MWVALHCLNSLPTKKLQLHTLWACVILLISLAFLQQRNICGRPLLKSSSDSSDASAADKKRDVNDLTDRAVSPPRIRRADRPTPGLATNFQAQLNIQILRPLVSEVCGGCRGAQ